MIPNFQEIMLPLLKQLSDKNEHNFRDLVEKLAKEFKLSLEERKELLSSGNKTIFNSRLGWAMTYLKKAGLISTVKRGIYSITDEGLKVLNSNKNKINVKFLKTIPKFLEFYNLFKVINGKEEETISNEILEFTPEENLEKAYQNIRKSLAAELLNKVIELSPTFFEKLVVELLVKMGYGGSIKDAGKALGRVGDEGIDGTIKEDKIGLDVIYIQAKRWKPGNLVGRPELHKFVGALAGQGAKKGIFITTSSFTKDAIYYTPKNETKIVLIYGDELSQLMIDYNIGCTTQQIYEIKKVDIDYFEDN